jgi:hypothetical protein
MKGGRNKSLLKDSDPNIRSGRSQHDSVLTNKKCLLGFGNVRLLVIHFAGQRLLDQVWKFEVPWHNHSVAEMRGACRGTGTGSTIVVARGDLVAACLLESKHDRHSTALGSLLCICIANSTPTEGHRINGRTEPHSIASSCTLFLPAMPHKESHVAQMAA